MRIILCIRFIMGITLLTRLIMIKLLFYFKKSLKSLKGLSNIDSSEFATRYNSLGNAYYEKGEYDRAIPYYQSALSIDTTVLGRTILR